MYKLQNAYGDSDLVKAITEPRGRVGAKDKRVKALRVREDICFGWHDDDDGGGAWLSSLSSFQEEKIKRRKAMEERTGRSYVAQPGDSDDDVDDDGSRVSQPIFLALLQERMLWLIDQRTICAILSNFETGHVSKLTCSHSDGTRG